MIRSILTAVLAPAIVAGGLASHASAQESASSFPSRPIKLVVSSAPGGFNDVVGRVVAGGFAASPAMNGQPGVVDNRPGGGGIIAAQYTANSPADGYAILMADTAITSIIPVLSEKPPFDSLRDFVPVSLVVTAPFFLAVNADLGVSTVGELVTLAKSKPGKLFYGSSGPGSIHHLATETLKTNLGIDIVHVPFKSSALSTPALLAGDIQVLFTALGPVLPHVKSGRVRLIGVASPKRSPRAPDVPTFAEAGIKDLQLEVSLHALAPAATPPAIVAKLATEIRKAIHTPDALKQFDAVGMDPVGSTSDESLATLKAERAFFTRAVKISGAKATD